ncbi:hypothetical protein [Enterovibrio norvegicus]|uniref:hypothetical protein n=1 Tax=Enterovibrio norvegicus TaxID=188144 RepID=UPI000C828EC4|nr:hypothetical protein [Enterovibrio norvegicus]PMH59627.1 hypothetical protein BCU62_22280 [Enterovibrio norvegicus]
MHIVLGTYKDPAFGLDWHEQTPHIEKETRQLLLDSKLPLQFAIHERNIGRGADWPVTVLEIIGFIGIASFAIPEAHKRVREALEEWSRIREYFNKCIDLLCKKDRLIALPQEVLFIKSVELLLSELNESDAVYIKHETVHSIGSHEEYAGLMGFYFDCSGKRWRVVINGQGEVKLIERV